MDAECSPSSAGGGSGSSPQSIASQRREMSEWAQAVRERLVSLEIDPTRHSAVIDELAQHLDERYAALLAHGLTATEARRHVAAELDDEALERELRSEEHTSELQSLRHLVCR